MTAIRRHWKLALLTLLLLALLAGCATVGSPLTSDPDVTGVILEAEPAIGAVRGRFLAEGDDGGQYWVSSDEATRFYAVAADGRLERISYQDLTAGMRVRVWFSGPILESFPAQGTAAQVVVGE